MGPATSPPSSDNNLHDRRVANFVRQPCHYSSTVLCILGPVKAQSHTSFTFDRRTLASRDLTYGTSPSEQPDDVYVVTSADKTQRTNGQDSAK